VSGVVVLLSAAEAQRLTQRIKLTASGVRDGLFKLRNLVDEAKNSNAWQVLGFASWTAYLADTLADEPMRLGREERQELVGYLSGEGLSTRAIAPIVGVDKDTVRRDVIRGGVNTPPASTPTPERHVPVAPRAEEVAQVRDALGDEVADAYAGMAARFDAMPEAKSVTGLDGKTYKRSTPKPERRRALVDDAYAANTNLWKAIESIRSISNDDRFTRNKADILAALQPSADLAIEILTDLFNITLKEN
jgi:transposase-like protein